MAGPFTALVILALLIALAAIATLARSRGIGLLQATGLAKFKILYGLDEGDGLALKSGSPTLVLYSRQSALDVALLWCLMPGRVCHALHPDDRKAFVLTGLRLFSRLIDAGDEEAIATALKDGFSVTLATPPEIEPSPETLALYDRLAATAAGSNALIAAFHLRGSGHSSFSSLPREKAVRSMFPRLRFGVSPLIDPANPPEAESGAGNPAIEDRIHDLQALARFRSNDINRGLFLAFRDAADRHGARGTVLEDALGGKLTYKRAMIGARALAKRLAAMSAPGEALGILLPNANGVIVTLLALLSGGRVAAMLNYTAGPAAVTSALRTADIRTVLASRAFIEKAGLEPLVAAIEAMAGVTIIWLEELRETITLPEKAAAFLSWRQPIVPLRDASAPAVILFTSGSEGTPKGVVLSHRNLLANAAQAEARIDISVADKLFNVLPVFHSFGLTGGAILPLLYGVRLFLYPSPLHYRLIPAVAKEVRPTIMFGTDTFLAGYARAAKGGEFESLRLIVAGAEAVREETRRIWKERFGATIVEGFGMTEASPVVAVNSAAHGRDGTVGRLLPAMAARVMPVEGIMGAGRLHIAGPNVMLGYMLADHPGQLQPLEGDWHDSGDIVAIDDGGFITIRGRAKRFAKIAGEMISLGAIEMMVQRLWPEAAHAAIAVADSRKGERIVLVTTQMPALRDDLRDYSKRYGATELMVPNEIINVAEIPVLGSGKTDYVTAQKIADEWVEAHRAGTR